MLRFNNVHCQWIIHLCRRRTVNTIALPPLTVGAAGTRTRNTELTCKDANIQSMTHRHTLAQRSGREVITLLDQRVLNQPHVVFSSSPADGELMASGLFYIAVCSSP